MELVGEGVDGSAGAVLTECGELRWWDVVVCEVECDVWDAAAKERRGSMGACCVLCCAVLGRRGRDRERPFSLPPRVQISLIYSFPDRCCCLARH